MKLPWSSGPSRVVAGPTWTGLGLLEASDVGECLVLPVQGDCSFPEV